MSSLTQLLAVATLLVVPALGAAQNVTALDDTSDLTPPGTVQAGEGATLGGPAQALETVDDATSQPFGELEGMQASGGPIAYATILADGRKHSGTSNVTSSYNSALDRYEITIRGERYYYLSYSTLVTPAGDAGSCRTGSVGGRLTVACVDPSGRAQPARFAFVTFRD